MSMKSENEQQPLQSTSTATVIKGSRNLYLSCGAAYLGALNVGISLGFSSPLIKSIIDDTSISHIHLSDTDQSWIGSLVTLGAMVGGMLAGDFMHRGGRKFCAIFSSIPFVTGLLLISYAQNVGTICAGRVLCGLATGVTSLIVPVYISEISPPQLRGLLGSGNQLAIVTGIFLAYLIGGALSWRWFALISAIFPVLFGFCCLFVKESPRYLYFKNNQLEAVQALHWLRGEEADCSREIRDLEDNFRQGSTDEATWREMFMKKQYRTPLILSLLLMFFQQFSGVNAIMFYLETIFRSAGFTTDSQLHMASLLVSGIQIVSTLISCLIVDKLGRRSLLMFSSIVMCAALVAFSLYFHFTSNGSLSWLSLSAVMIDIVAFSFGLGPIPWFMVSELTSTRARSKCGSMATFFNYLCAFVVTKEFSDMEKGMTSSGVFGFFAAVCFISFLFTLIKLPETKGKSLEEIEDLFKPGGAEYEELA